MELLERFAQGELEAFETLFRQFQGQVYGWILRIVRDTGAAEDLTVETFWRIYRARARSEEHTSELQSRSDLVCRLLLEKKKKKKIKVADNSTTSLVTIMY